jgi:hypothetical protein
MSIREEENKSFFREKLQRAERIAHSAWAKGKGQREKGKERSKTRSKIKDQGLKTGSRSKAQGTRLISF